MEASDTMKAMADRIADKMYPRTHPGWIGGQHCALAAIMETQEAIAAFVETHAYFSSGPDSGMQPSKLARDDRHHATIARYIRTGEHYALAGDRHG